MAEASITVANACRGVCQPDNAIYMMLVLHPLSLNPGEKAVINLMVRLPAFIKMTKARVFSVDA